MLRGYEAYSTTRKKGSAIRYVFLLLRFAVVIFFLYLALTAFLLKPYRVVSVSMTPDLAPNDRVLATPLAYGIKLPFLASRIAGLTVPKRGDLVVVMAPGNPELGFFAAAANSFIRFFSLQSRGTANDEQGNSLARYLIKRVVGVPGDTVRLESYRAFIKTAAASQFQSEIDTIPFQFSIGLEPPSETWPKRLPLSGNMSELTLEQNEYFVLGDNRANSSDSRSWGPVSFDMLVAKVVFRYWPPHKISIP